MILNQKKKSVKKKLEKFPIEYYYPFEKRTYFKVKFAKKEIRDQFNIGLNKIKDKGVIKEIYKKYVKSITAEDLKWSVP